MGGYCRLDGGITVTDLSSDASKGDIGEFGMIVLTPDTAELRLCAPILERLRNRLNATIMGAIPHQYTPSDVLVTYRDRATHKRNSEPVSSTFIAGDFFALGPSLMVFLWRPLDLSGRELQADIAASKGPSAYGMASPDDLRSLSPVCDRCLSLVHSPDTRADFEFELKRVLGIEAARLYIKGIPSAVTASDLSFIFDRRELQSQGHPLSPLFYLFQAAPMLGGVYPRTDSNEHFRERCKSLLDLIRCRLPELIRQPPAQAWRSVLEFAAPFNALSKLAELQEHSTLFAALALACSPEEFGTPELMSLCDAARLCGVGMPPWDVHRLNLILRFHRS